MDLKIRMGLRNDAVNGRKKHKRRRRMKKGELINKVAEVVSTKKEAQAAVDCILATITEALKKEDPVTLVGFGTFKAVKREARTGRNPQTGEAIQIPARKVPKFLPGKGLKEAVK
jgi:DNA-binding protein HU-beta